MSDVGCGACAGLKTKFEIVSQQHEGNGRRQGKWKDRLLLSLGCLNTGYRQIPSNKGGAFSFSVPLSILAPAHVSAARSPGIYLNVFCTSPASKPGSISRAGSQHSLTQRSRARPTALPPLDKRNHHEKQHQACSYIRKLAAEKNNTDMLVAECHLRVKSMEESVLAAVLQMEDAGAGVAVAAANSAASDDEFFHDSIGAEGEKEAAGENPSARDVSLRIAVRSDVSSARRRAPRGDSAYSCSDTGTSSLSSSSSLCASGGSGVGDDRQPAVAPEDKAALDETFSALARKVDTSAVRAEVLSDIAAARRAKASAHASDPDCSNSGAGSDGGGGVGRGVGSNESGDAETSPLAILAAERDQFEKKKKAGEAPVLHRHDSQSSLFPSPPSMHGTPANNPAGVKVNAGVTKRKDEDDHDHDHDKVSKGISISNGLLCANVAHGTPSAAENEAVNRRPSTGNFGKRGPSIAERLRAAAAGPAIKLTTATRVGFGIGTPSSAKEERDLLVLLESPHRGGVRASAAADAATGGAEGEAGIHATAKKKPFRFHPFRQSLSLHPGSAAGDVLAGEGPAGAPAGAGNGGRPAGAGAWVTIDSNEGDRARSLLLRRHGLEFLKDVRAPRRWRKVGAAERVGCGVVGEVFPLQFDDPVQQHAVRDFTNGVGLVAKRVFKVYILECWKRGILTAPLPYLVVKHGVRRYPCRIGTVLGFVVFTCCTRRALQQYRHPWSERSFAEHDWVQTQRVWRWHLVPRNPRRVPTE